MPPRRAPLPWLKPGLFAGALLPLASLLWRVAHRTLGADAVAIGLNQLGYLALVFLMASLACTPLKILTGWTWPIRVRRMLGLFTVFYAGLHLVTYVAVDQQLDWAVLWGDVTQRRFMIVGFIAFLLLLPLAWTSTDASVRRLGFQRWKALHRLAYVAGVLAVVHFFWRVKLDTRVPLTWAAILGVLFLVRVVDGIRARRRRRARPATPPRRVDVTTTG
ncbi:MAG TPA: protein-methionine-sulfoxide reductase heme-binding subunit MsrQ [Myxococcaceae bacterium]|nr:protein-methionine-sulfoxide reductase heme-binding subunit MsrQ [Myxococcaceae bacterium]